MNFRNVIINIISILASLIAIFVFLTGYTKIVEIIPNFNNIPLFRTMLNNDGWINGLIIVIILVFIENCFKKKKRNHLENIIKRNSTNWNKESNSALILRELKILDNKYIVVRNFLLFTIAVIIITIIHHTNLLDEVRLPKNCLIDLRGNSDIITCTGKTNKLFDTSFLIIGQVSKKTNINEKLSIFPKNFEIPKIYLSSKNNIIIIENKWIFFIIIFIIISALILTIDNIFSLQILLIIKKLKINKYHILNEHILKTQFNESFIKNYALQKLKTPNKTLERK